MKEYKVKVTDSKTEWYNLNDERHREDGPAVEWTDGTKCWYINGECKSIGKIVEIDGKKYKLNQI